MSGAGGWTPLRPKEHDVVTSGILTEFDVISALWRLHDRCPYATDTEQLTLHDALLDELPHPCEGLNANAAALLAYVWQTRSSQLLWSYRVEIAVRPHWWHSYRWHVRHRPWLVECS